MRRVQVRRPSFPTLPVDGFTESTPQKVWQVLCGDAGHWRAGLYSPDFSRLEQIMELEQHDCPELFFLLSGRLVLVLEKKSGELQEVELPPGRGILVTSPHNGYCPLGPHTGLALVVERDEFDTVYKTVRLRQS